MVKDINYYLSLGYEYDFAVYFAKGKSKLLDVFANPDYTLTLKFNDCTKIYDMKPLLTDKNNVFYFLNDFRNFKRVYLDDTKNPAWDKDPTLDSNIHWNNKVDISADTCYVLALK